MKYLPFVILDYLSGNIVSMKKAFSIATALIGCTIAIFSCTKNTPMVTTINPSMSANIGTYRFEAASVVPTTLDTQSRDTSTMLIITGNTADKTSPRDKIILRITNYKNQAGTFSIVKGEASAFYYHNGVTIGGVYGQIYDTAAGGIVSITRINNNSITGYFNFTANNGLTVSNGNFTVGKPWNF
jgi:hypothetical protein